MDTSRTKNSSNVANRLPAQVPATLPPGRTSSLGVDSSSTSVTKRSRTKLNQSLVQPQGHVLQEQPSQPPAVPHTQTEHPVEMSRSGTHPEYFTPGSNNVRHSSDDSDITSLMEVMDKDFDNTQPASSDVFTEQPLSPATKSTKGMETLYSIYSTVQTF